MHADASTRAVWPSMESAPWMQLLTHRAQPVHASRETVVTAPGDAGPVLTALADDAFAPAWEPGPAARDPLAIAGPSG